MSLPCPSVSIFLFLDWWFSSSLIGRLEFTSFPMQYAMNKSSALTTMAHWWFNGPNTSFVGIPCSTLWRESSAGRLLSGLLHVICWTFHFEACHVVFMCFRLQVTVLWLSCLLKMAVFCLALLSHVSFLYCLSVVSMVLVAVELKSCCSSLGTKSVCTYEGFCDKMRHIHFWRFSFYKLKQ